MVSNYSLLEKNPLIYKREKQDCQSTNIDVCTNSFEMYQTVNIKAMVIQNGCKRYGYPESSCR